MIRRLVLGFRYQTPVHRQVLIVHNPRRAVTRSTADDRALQLAAVIRDRRLVTLPDEVRELAEHQLGLVSRAQFQAAGVSRSTLQWHVGRHWPVVLPGVYALNRGGFSVTQRQVAGLLYAGPSAVLRGLTAARAWGITAADSSGRVHVTVASPARSRRLGWLEVAATTIPDPRIEVRGPLVLPSPARAVVDACAEVDITDQAEAMAIEAVRRRLVTWDDLAHAFYLRNRRGSAVIRRALDAAATGAWSRPEAVLLAAIEASTVLPRPWANLRLIHQPTGQRLLTPDVWFDDVAMAVMVHSRQFHSAPGDWDMTVARDAQLTECGVIVVGTTPTASTATSTRSSGEFTARMPSPARARDPQSARFGSR